MYYITTRMHDLKKEKEKLLCIYYSGKGKHPYL